MASRAARTHAASLLAHYPAAFITDAHIDALATDLEREGLDIADDVVALLRLRCRNAPTGADIHETAREVRRETMSPRMDIGYSSIPSPLGADQWAHGAHHLEVLLSLPKDERTDEMRDLARYPQRCGCDMRKHSDYVYPGRETT